VGDDIKMDSVRLECISVDWIIWLKLDPYSELLWTR